MFKIKEYVILCTVQGERKENAKCQQNHSSSTTSQSLHDIWQMCLKN